MSAGWKLAPERRLVFRNFWMVGKPEVTQLLVCRYSLRTRSYDQKSVGGWRTTQRNERSRMERRSFQHKDLKFSWLDAGGKGSILIALHAHWMEAATFRRLAIDLAPGWRVVALDQRGHGHSSHAATYTRQDYLGDLEAFFAELQVSAPAVLVGNSLGGINALQFAAKHPNLVRALVLEDIAVEPGADIGFVRAWSGNFPTRDALAERIGPRFLPYLEDSFRESRDGWRLAFDPEDMVRSEESLKGQYWQERLSTTCPALVIRGRDSRVTTRQKLEEMALRRPNTIFMELQGGHVVHQDSPEMFADDLRSFLQSLETGIKPEV
jgi:pimeloyl-ACP methyl ester carboxylesterase